MDKFPSRGTPSCLIMYRSMYKCIIFVSKMKRRLRRRLDQLEFPVWNTRPDCFQVWFISFLGWLSPEPSRTVHPGTATTWLSSREPSCRSSTSSPRPCAISTDILSTVFKPFGTWRRLRSSNATRTVRRDPARIPWSYTDLPEPPKRTGRT